MTKTSQKNATLKTRMFRYDFPEFTVGTAEYGKGPTGCTAILFPSGAQVAYDARGGAVSARETLSADPLNEWGECDGIVFAGGSTYGLDAAGGVLRRILRARGTVDSMEIPSVPSAVVYDFSGRDNQILPDAKLGETAFDRAAPNKVLIGRAGAGANTTVGSFFGDEYAMPSGQGAAFLEVGGIKVFALAVVNALGNIRDRSGRFVAGGRIPGEIDILDVASHLYGLIEKESGHAYDDDHKPAITPIYDAKDGPSPDAASPDALQKNKDVENVGVERVAAGKVPKKSYSPSAKDATPSGENTSSASHEPEPDDTDDTESRKKTRKGPGKATTLSIVVTNVALNRLELKRVAVMAHAALGRIIDPFHTPEDGDIVYACSTASMKLPGDTSVADVGVLAGRCLQDAVLSTFSL